MEPVAQCAIQTEKLMIRACFDLQLPRGVLVVLLGDLDDGERVDHDELAHAIHLERFGGWVSG